MAVSVGRRLGHHRPPERNRILVNDEDVRRLTDEIRAATAHIDELRAQNDTWKLAHNGENSPGFLASIASWEEKRHRAEKRLRLLQQAK